MNKKLNYEILAPVGSPEMFEAAMASKANAVYLAGTKFGARAYANNFSIYQLNKLIQNAHKEYMKVYIAVNTLVKDSEFGELYDYLLELNSLDVDALIVQDIGVYYFIKRYFPDFELHASTQMAVNNLNSARYIEKLGFDRVVVGREVSLSEIKQIRDNTNLEIEAFVHGSLCVSVSGQCYISSYIGQRSGNRGRCAQPCRKTYDLVDRNDRKISQVSDTLISARDLMTIYDIGEMIEAGVYSLKIEGRMKKPEYVYSVVNEYRNAIEKHDFNPDNLTLVSNRKFTKGLFFGDFGRNYYQSKNDIAGVLIGKVENLNKKAYITLEKPVYKGDVLSVETQKSKKLTITITQDYKEYEKIFLEKFSDLKDASNVYKIFSNRIVENLEHDRNNLDKKGISIVLTANIDSKMKAHVIYESMEFDTFSDYVVQKAGNKPMQLQQVEEQMNRMGNTDYVIENLDIQMDDLSFIPKSKLNELRRNITAKLDELIIKREEKKYLPYSPSPAKKNLASKNLEYSLNYEYYLQLNQNIDLNIFKRVYTHNIGDIRTLRERFDGQIFYVLPRIMYKEDYDLYEEKLNKEIEYFDGLSCNSLGDIEFARKLGKYIHLESFLNVFNSEAVKFYKEQGIEDISLSTELNLQELTQLEIEDTKAEIIGYGRMAQMLLKHCPASVVKGCVNDSNCATCPFRKDIKLENELDRLPVVRANGYSEVLTDKLINIINIREDIDNTNIRSIRIIDREDDNIEEIVEDFNKVYIKNIKSLDKKKNYLGHFKMGVI